MTQHLLFWHIAYLFKYVNHFSASSRALTYFTIIHFSYCCFYCSTGNRHSLPPIMVYPKDIDDITKISLPVFGMASYKVKGSIWGQNGISDHQKANSLMQAADKWLRSLQVSQPDFQFFSSHGTYWRWQMMTTYMSTCLLPIWTAEITSSCPYWLFDLHPILVRFHFDFGWFVFSGNIFQGKSPEQLVRTICKMGEESNECEM